MFAIIHAFVKIDESRGVPASICYAASKAALESVTRSLAWELGEWKEFLPNNRAGDEADDS